MADAQGAQVPAALVAGKKKFKNKKKVEQVEKNAEEPPLEQPSSNGHAQEVKPQNTQEELHQEQELELNGLLKQLHLCNGHGGAGSTVEKQEEEALPALNGHHSNNNNNHIRSSSSNSNNGKSCHNNNVDSSNNNSKPRDLQSASATATNKTTANTQTTTTTKTSPDGPQVEATGSGSNHEKKSEGEGDEGETEEPVSCSTLGEGESTHPALQVVSQLPEPAISADNIVYKEYEAEHQMHDIMRLIQAELSEPYSIYTYRYFIYNWPKLCFLASHGDQYVGAIVCKLDMHMNVRRGYIAMLAVRKEYRKLKIGTTLVTKAIEAMLADNADEVVLETEMRNEPALRLYENLGFVRDKRLFRYYLNGVDALRLKLWFR
ncbi:hypothetical protein KR009_003694 [Drosophila setifemur]|nr:hypothetical protein KR009_003694 [Drosophila setifemur]